MKIKTIIITVGLIITMISGVKTNYFNTATNEVKTKDTVVSDETVIEDEILKVEDSKVEEFEIEVEQKQDEVVEVEKEEVIESHQEETVSTPKEIQNTSSKIETNVPQNSTQKENKQTITPVQEEKKETVVEPPKQETPVTKTITPSDLEYWCVAGGSHHIAGDGANEHGYYSSWDEAYQAFLNYTNGWSSVQFKVSQCSCGLYYFWAIQ